MSRQGLRTTSQRLQSGLFAEIKPCIHNQSHAELHTIHTKIQSFYTTYLTELEIIGIMVVSPAVTSREERFTSILCCRQTKFQLVVGRELQSQIVALLITQIAIDIALTFIKWLT